MSFLGLGKKDKKKELPPLKFPDISIPKYEPLIPPIRKEPFPKMPEIPIRRTLPEKSKTFSQPEIILPTPSPPTSTAKNIFVKIERYKIAMKLMKDIRNKLDETKKIMDKLNEIKNQENKEIELWENNLLEIKNKLESVDKNLFS